MRKKLILTLTAENNLFKSRLKVCKNSGKPEFWQSTFEELVALGTITIKNQEKFLDEELDDFIKLYKMGAVIHNPMQNTELRKRSLETLNIILDTILDRHAYLIGMKKEELLKAIEEEKKNIYSLQLYDFQSRGKKNSTNGKVVGDTLNLPELLPELPAPQETKNPTLIKTEVITASFDSKERVRISAMTKKRIEEESAIKFAIQDALVGTYKNLEEFEYYFDMIKDINRLRDISNPSNNPTLRQEKIKAMNDHIRKLELYFSKIKTLYNDFYNLIISIESGTETATLEEFMDVKNLVSAVKQISIALKEAAGAPISTVQTNPRTIPVKEFKKRRMQVALGIQEYNRQLSLLIGEELEEKQGFKLG